MKFFKPLKLIVEYQSNDYTKSLENQIIENQKEKEKLEDRIINLERQYARASYLNMELIDILNENGIRFRDRLKIKEL